MKDIFIDKFLGFFIRVYLTGIEFKSVTSGGLDAATNPGDFVATDAWIEFPAGDHTAEASFR